MNQFIDENGKNNLFETIPPSALDNVNGGNWLRWGKKVIEWTGGLLRAYEGSGRGPQKPNLPPPERPAIIDPRPAPQPPKLPDGTRIDWP